MAGIAALQARALPLGALASLRRLRPSLNAALRFGGGVTCRAVASDSSAQFPSMSASPAPEDASAGTRRGRRRGEPTPAFRVKLLIREAAKAKSWPAALAAYEAARAERVPLEQDSYDVLLYLCSGGEDWDVQALRRSGAEPLPEMLSRGGEGEGKGGRAAEEKEEGKSGAVGKGQEQGKGGGAAEGKEDGKRCAVGESREEGDGGGLVEGQEEVQESKRPRLVQNAPSSVSLLPTATLPCPEEALRLGEQLFAEQSAASVGSAPSEMSYTALARLAAAAGRFEAALEHAARAQAAGATPRTRTFVPALLCGWTLRDPGLAFRALAAMDVAGVEVGEPEYALLLRAAAHGAPWAMAQPALKRMREELALLSPGTVAAVRLYFLSLGGWEVEAGAGVDPDSGHCAACGETLQAVDLDDQDSQALQDSVVQLAERLSKGLKGQFAVFQKWLQQHGPFPIVVDGANVAFFGQNYDEGGFNFAQIKAMVKLLQETYPSYKVLTVLHEGRIRSKKISEAGKTFLADCRKNQTLFATPTGSNDDWYWMYAAVAAGPEGRLVSNDEMRDHMFQLLAPRYFSKWKQRHQIHYSLDERSLQLEHPAIYTKCIQSLSNGAWMFPCVDGTWLCVRPTKA